MAESKLKPCAMLQFCTTQTSAPDSKRIAARPCGWAPDIFDVDLDAETRSFYWRPVVLLSEAQRLEAEVRRLREALRHYASGCDATETTPCGYEGNLCCKVARAAIKGEKE